MKENITDSLYARAQRIQQYRKQGIKLNSQLGEVRLKIGNELIQAGYDVEALGTNLSREEWYEQNVNLPNRSIQRFIASARNANPARAREHERARRQSANTAAKNPAQARERGNAGYAAAEQTASRTASVYRARDEGTEAFLCGVPQCDCPYSDPQRYAAWRTGWCEMEALVKYGPRPAAAVSR